MANGVAKFAHNYYGSKAHYRGGKYAVGFWTMSNHVAYGTLTGALPSGRLSGKAFTPGLTPEPYASKNLLDNIRDVARLDTETVFHILRFRCVQDLGQLTLKNPSNCLFNNLQYFE